MAKTLLLVESRPASPEQVDDYHIRHEGTHVPKMISVDGFVSARRWRADDGESERSRCCAWSTTATVSICGCTTYRSLPGRA